jgi:hypothetical protein
VLVGPQTRHGDLCWLLGLSVPEKCNFGAF